MNDEEVDRVACREGQQMGVSWTRRARVGGGLFCGPFRLGPSFLGFSSGGLVK
jgi:hypothetical protein